MTRWLRSSPLIVLVLLVAALATGMPVLAGAAYDAVNADKVDGRHAVGSSATAPERAGKLVATNSTGRLPNNIIAKAPDAQQLDGLDSTAFSRGGTWTRTIAFTSPPSVPLQIPGWDPATRVTCNQPGPVARLALIRGQGLYMAMRTDGSIAEINAADFAVDVSTAAVTRGTFQASFVSDTEVVHITGLLRTPPSPSVCSGVLTISQQK